MEAVAPVAGKLQAGDTRRRFAAQPEATLSIMPHTAPDVFYRVLSSPIRRLCGELQVAASAYGFLDSGRAATRLSDGCGGQKQMWEPRLPGPGVFPPSNSSVAVSSGLGPSTGSQQKESKTHLPLTRPWRFGTSLTAGMLATGWAVTLIIGSRLEHFLIVMPTTIVLGIAFCWAVARGLLELTVRRSARRLHRLLADLHFQHKIAREAVRWVVELEVTFKALSVAPAESQQLPDGVVGPDSRAADTEGRAEKPLSEHPQQTVDGKPCCACSFCLKSTRKKPAERTRNRRSGRERDFPAGRLRKRLCQVLEWQEEILQLIYENIMRPKGDGQTRCGRLISQGPWEFRTSKGNAPSDGSIRALKDITARSWAAHSKLSAGIQICVRQLLFSLGTQQHRSLTGGRQKSVFDAGKILTPPVAREESGVRPSRALRKVLLTLQQHQQPLSGNNRSLGEEVKQATTKGRDTTRKTPISPTARNQIPPNRNSASMTQNQRNQRVKGSASSAALPREEVVRKGAYGPRLVWILYRKLALGVVNGFIIIRGALDGIAAAWWLVRQLNQLNCSISVAGQVAKSAADTLRILLEEDWVSCPVSLPQPPWISGMFKEARRHRKNGEAKEEYVDLIPCAALPPAAAFQPFNNLPGAAAPARRIALASMSRHVAASLALLRLPSLSYSCNCNQQRTGSWCISQTGSCDRPCLFYTKSTHSTGGIGKAKDRQDFEVDKDGLNTQEIGLSDPLRLALRHLRVALEEGEKLQQSLRLPGNTVRIIGALPPREAAPEPLLKVTDGQKASDEVNEVPQPQACHVEPVRFLEVYTAVGQDCSSNKQRCQEEAALLAAFADEDPAIRERSQITLRELEIRLQGQQLELQNRPRVFKELSAVAPVTAEGCGCDADSNDGIVCIVATESPVSGQPCDVQAFSAGCHNGAEAVHQPSVHSPDTDEGNKDRSACLISGSTPTDDKGNDRIRKGNIFSSRQGRDGTFACESNDVPVTSSYPEGGSLWPDNESIAFRLRQQRLRGDLTASLWQSSEAVASRNLFSELQGVLTEQRRTRVQHPLFGHCYGKTPDSTVGGLRLDIGGDCGPTAFGDDCTDEEEWDSCGVVEGPTCSTEAPVWVAAPLVSGEGTLGITGEQEEGATDQQQSPQ